MARTECAVIPGRQTIRRRCSTGAMDNRFRARESRRLRKVLFATTVAAFVAGCSNPSSPSSGPWSRQLRDYARTLVIQPSVPVGRQHTFGQMQFTNTTGHAVLIERAVLIGKPQALRLDATWWMTGRSAQIGVSAGEPERDVTRLPVTVRPGAYGSVGVSLSIAKRGRYWSRGVDVRYSIDGRTYRVFFPLGIGMCTVSNCSFPLKEIK